MLVFLKLMNCGCKILLKTPVIATIIFIPNVYRECQFNVNCFRTSIFCRFNDLKLHTPHFGFLNIQINLLRSGDVKFLLLDLETKSFRIPRKRSLHLTTWNFHDLKLCNSSKKTGVTVEWRYIPIIRWPRN